MPKKIDYDIKINQVMEKKKSFENKRNDITAKIKDMEKEISMLQKEKEIKEMQEAYEILQEKGLSVEDLRNAVISGKINKLKENAEVNF